MSKDVSKSNFVTILSNMKGKYEIIDSKWTENKQYNIKFRTHITVDELDYNTSCDQWVEQFSFVTETVWVHKISNTGPKVRFRKQYQCWSYPNQAVNTSKLFDPCKCRAILDVKILGNLTPGRRKISRYEKLGLNSLIKLSFLHLHSVDSTKDYAFFVQWCKPLVEPPKPTALPTEKLSQLIAKVVKAAPFTAQKAAQRVKEAVLKHQEALPHTDNPPASQDMRKDMFYIHQVVFDSATQTLKQITSVSNCTVNHSDDDHPQVIEMQVTGDVNATGHMVQQFSSSLLL